MSSPNTIGSSKSSKRKAKSESKGKEKAFTRCHRAALEASISIIWHTRSVRRPEVSRKGTKLFETALFGPSGTASTAREPK
jgi:hypothetical protein